MRDVGRFFRASWDRSIDSAGRLDFVVGSILALAGWAMHVDFGPLAVAVVLSVLLLRVLVLSPAAMWRDAEEYQRKHKLSDGAPIIGSVEAGGAVTINNYYGEPGFSASSNTNIASATAAATAQAVAAIVDTQPTLWDDQSSSSEAISSQDQT